MSILIGIAYKNFGCLASDGREMDTDGHVVKEDAQKIFRVHSSLAVGAVGNTQIDQAVFSAVQFKASDTFGRLSLDGCIGAVKDALQAFCNHPDKIKISPATQVMILGLDQEQNFCLCALTMTENFQLKSNTQSPEDARCPVLIAPPPDMPRDSVYQEIFAMRDLVRQSIEMGEENRILDRVQQVVLQTAAQSRCVNSRCRIVRLTSTLDS